MADKKISQLDAAGALTGSELLELVQDGASVKGTIGDILSACEAGFEQHFLLMGA